jgi:hypothetical protein
MGRGDFKQRVIFEVDDQASAPVGKIQGTFGKLGSFLSSRFAITLGDVVGLFKSVAGAAGSVIDAAQQQEKSVAALDQALASLGPAAAGASEALQAQAAALEKTTQFGDEAIIQNQALALNLGVSADQAGKLTQAAVELSAGLKISLESATTNLARTMNGFRGELGELVPEVATMGVEALKSGAALDVVLDRFGGQAQAQTKTFSGLVAQLGNAWGTVKEKLGAAITENEAIRGSLEKLKNVITAPAFLDAIEFIATGFATITLNAVELVSKVGAAKEALEKFADKVKALKERITEALGPFATFLGFIGGRLVDQATAGVTLLGRVGDAFGFVAQKTGIAADFNDAYERSTVKADESARQFQDRLLGLAAAGGDELAPTLEDLGDKTNALTTETDSATESLLTFEEANRAVQGGAEDLTRELERTARAAAQVQSATGGRLTARDRRSQADVDAALAVGRTAFMGGTRIRTADGSGSRLVR